jgi:hypothetical protein
MNAENEHPIKQPPPETNLKTDMVDNIPVHSEAGSRPTPIKDGDDMDEIMEQVGSELKKDDHRPPKHHWCSKKKRKEVNFQAAPVQRHHDLAAPVPQPQPPSPAPHPIQPAAKPRPAPRDKSSAPVLVITLTIIVTGILIAAAISAYK